MTIRKGRNKDNRISKELHAVQRYLGKASLWPTEHTLTVVPGTGVGESTVERRRTAEHLLILTVRRGKGRRIRTITTAPVHDNS